MSLVSRYIINNLIDAHHPTFNSTHCVNRKQRRLVCTKCKDICPTGVFQQKRGEPPAWNHCTNCNLCVSACPSRCLTPAGDTLERYLEGYDGSGVVRLGCWKETEVCKIKEECVGAIPWEFIAYLCLRMKVDLFVRRCDGCPNATGKTMWQDNLARVQRFLQGTPWAVNLTIIRTGEDIPKREDQSYSRRELLTKMKNSALLAAMKLVPKLEEEDVDGFLFRRLLNGQVQTIYDQVQAQNQQALQEYEERRRLLENGESQLPRTGQAPQTILAPKPIKVPVTVQLPRLTDQCFACGTCAKFCPQEAISCSQEKDGKRGVYITPWKCTGCGVCQAVCISKGIEGMAHYSVPHMEKILLGRVPSASCEICGQAIDPKKDSKLCVLCGVKQKTKR